MGYKVDFTSMSEAGLENANSTIRKSLAGLRANEARYFHTHYAADFITFPASEKPQLVDLVNEILQKERGIALSSKIIEVADLTVPNQEQFSGRARWIYAFCENGLCLNILYSLDSPRKRAVGFKLCEGAEQPEELSSFKFARQKSRLAGIIRGSFFVIKNEYPL